MKIGIIGQGYVGFPLAVHAAEAGNTVIGFDIDAGKVSEINSGRFTTPGLTRNPAEWGALWGGLEIRLHPRIYLL